MTFNASDKITANSDGTLTVGLSVDDSGIPTGGALNLIAPMLYDPERRDLELHRGRGHHHRSGRGAG